MSRGSISTGFLQRWKLAVSLAGRWVSFHARAENRFPTLTLRLLQTPLVIPHELPPHPDCHNHPHPRASFSVLVLPKISPSRQSHNFPARAITANAVASSSLELGSALSIVHQRARDLLGIASVGSLRNTCQHWHHHHHHRTCGEAPSSLSHRPISRISVAPLRDGYGR